jgi:hypothetical protein
MNKAFSELAVGDRFTMNGKEYVKSQEIRISCCQRINAHAISNSSEKIKVEPTTMVTVNA